MFLHLMNRRVSDIQSFSGMISIKTEETVPSPATRRRSALIPTVVVCNLFSLDCCFFNLSHDLALRNGFSGYADGVVTRTILLHPFHNQSCLYYDSCLSECLDLFFSLCISSFVEGLVAFFSIKIIFNFFSSSTTSSTAATATISSKTDFPMTIHTDTSYFRPIQTDDVHLCYRRYFAFHYPCYLSYLVLDLNPEKWLDHSLILTLLLNTDLLLGLALFPNQKWPFNQVTLILLYGTVRILRRKLTCNFLISFDACKIDELLSPSQSCNLSQSGYFL